MTAVWDWIVLNQEGLVFGAVLALFWIKLDDLVDALRENRNK
jgi:hypothetical protein